MMSGVLPKCSQLLGNVRNYPETPHWEGLRIGTARPGVKTGMRLSLVGNRARMAGFGRGCDEQYGALMRVIP